MKLIGIEHVTFTNNEGDEVSFDKVYLLSPIKAERGEGDAVTIINCSPSKTEGLTIGEDVEPLYNRFGKVRRFDYIVS